MHESALKAPPRRPRFLHRGDLSGLAVTAVGSAAFSSISIYRQDRFASGGFDLGIFDQTIWGYSRLEIVRNTVKGTPDLLGDHFHPALMLLAPLYWIWDDARVLLVAQAFLIAAASIPIFWWGREVLGRAAALALQITFLVFWGVLAAVMFDFHELALAAPAISFGLYGLVMRRQRLFWSMLALGCLAKEDVALTFVAMGIYAIVVQRRVRFGAAAVAVSAGWFASVLAVVIPAIAGRPYSYWNYPALGATPTQAVVTLLERPYQAVELLVDRASKRATLLSLLSAWAFLPLGSPLLLIAAPCIAERFWSANPSLWSTSFHYTVPIAPVLAFATIDTVSRLRTRVRSERFTQLLTLLPAAALLATFALSLAVTRPLAPLTGYMSAGNAAAVDACLDRIPPEASVAASDHLIPHLSHRAVIRPLYRGDGARYLAVSNAKPRAPTSRTLRSRRRLQQLRSAYRPVCHGGDATVLVRR